MNRLEKGEYIQTPRTLVIIQNSQNARPTRPRRSENGAFDGLNEGMPRLGLGGGVIEHIGALGVLRKLIILHGGVLEPAFCVENLGLTDAMLQKKALIKAMCDLRVGPIDV